MNQPPKVFTTICNIVEMPTDKVNQAWLDISEKVTNEFIAWLINEGNLTEDQLKSLETILTDAVADKTPAGNQIIELVTPILNEEQKDTITTKFADLFVINLDDFYSALKESMTLEQRQVTDSYIKTSYV